MRSQQFYNSVLLNSGIVGKFKCWTRPVFIIFFVAFTSRWKAFLAAVLVAIWWGRCFQLSQANAAQHRRSEFTSWKYSAIFVALQWVEQLFVWGDAMSKCNEKYVVKSKLFLRLQLTLSCPGNWNFPRNRRRLDSSLVPPFSQRFDRQFCGYRDFC